MTRFRVHLAVAVVSVLLAVPALLWWKESVLFVIALSLFANFYAAISALEAADDSQVLTAVAQLRDEIASLRCAVDRVEDSVDDKH